MQIYWIYHLIKIKGNAVIFELQVLQTGTMEKKILQISCYVMYFYISFTGKSLVSLIT